MCIEASWQQYQFTSEGDDAALGKNGCCRMVVMILGNRLLGDLRTTPACIMSVMGAVQQLTFCDNEIVRWSCVTRHLRFDGAPDVLTSLIGLGLLCASDKD